MKTLPISLALCMGVSLLCGTARAQAKFPFAVPVREQTQFSADDDALEHPVPVPREVLEVLRQDANVRNALQYDKLRPDQMPEDWFTASELHLHDPDHADLLVEARGQIAEANVCQFWVFLRTPDGLKLVLSHEAHDLVVSNDRQKGYKTIQTIELLSLVITETRYRYDPKRGYVKFSGKTGLIR